MENGEPQIGQLAAKPLSDEEVFLYALEGRTYGVMSSVTSYNNLKMEPVEQWITKKQAEEIIESRLGGDVFLVKYNSNDKLWYWAASEE